jgi:hypothetical protein
MGTKNRLIKTDTMENHLLSATSMKDTTMFVVLITVVALVSRGFDWVRETALSR